MFGLFGRSWVRHYDHTSFDLIDIQMFRSTSCRYLTGYASMYILILIQVAMFVSDIYTAVVLLAFDRWSSAIKPFVPFTISRWLFGGCIILSVVLWIYDFVMAWRTIRTRNISLNYTTPISRNYYSIRNYSYFCLFAKITKSKSKREYISLFVYFTFKGWIRFVLAESPRQVLNGLTIYSVFRIQNDFVNTIEKLAKDSLTEAVVLSFMAFSCLVWVFNLVQFVMALLLVCPLMAHITPRYSGIEEYCCARVDKRIGELVKKHHKKDLVELAKQNKTMKQPQLPSMNLSDDEGDPVKPIVRSTTVGCLVSQPSKTLQKTMADDRNPFADKIQHLQATAAMGSKNDLTRVNTADSLGSLTSVNSQASLLDHSYRRPSDGAYLPGGMLSRRPTEPLIEISGIRKFSEPTMVPKQVPPPYASAVPYPMRDPFDSRNQSLNSISGGVPPGHYVSQNSSDAILAGEERILRQPLAPSIPPPSSTEPHMSMGRQYFAGNQMGSWQDVPTSSYFNSASSDNGGGRNPFVDNMAGSAAHDMAPQLEEAMPAIPLKSNRRPSVSSNQQAPIAGNPLGIKTPKVQRQRMPSASDMDYDPTPLPRVRTAAARQPVNSTNSYTVQGAVRQTQASSSRPKYQTPSGVESALHFEGFDGVHTAQEIRDQNKSPARGPINVNSSANSLARIQGTLPKISIEETPSSGSIRSQNDTVAKLSRPNVSTSSLEGVQATLPNIDLDDDDAPGEQNARSWVSPSRPPQLSNTVQVPGSFGRPTLPKISIDDDDI